MKLYKISEISSICNVPSASIRFFEEKGILNPKRDLVNNYRYYTVWDINRLLEYKKYREMGFSLNETIDIINGDTSDFARMIKVKEEEAEKMAAYYELKAIKLRNHHNAIRKAGISLGSYTIVKSPAYYYILNRDFDGEDYTFSVKKNDQKVINKLYENYEFVENLFIVTQDCFNTRPVLPYCHWGLGIKKQWTDALDIPVDERLSYASSQNAIHTFIRTEDRLPFASSMFLPAVEYLEQNGYKLAGDILGIWIGTVTENGHEARYMEAWLPIQ